MYPRGEKESHLDTVRYEIDMLGYSLKRWRETGVEFDAGDRNSFLECFLLHYRVLLEFLSGIHNKPTDLIISRPQVWAMRKVDLQETSSLQKRSKALHKSYHSKISKFLQHCTRARADIPHKWYPETMYTEIQEILSEFETRFLHGSSFASDRKQISSPSPEGCHTAPFKRPT